ncbi:MAG: HNH endonuclease [Gemmatimonadaceae bacterium]
MRKFTDALSGYAFAVLQRDGFRCRYCGLDGTASFSAWLSLSWDHLLPRDHANRDDPTYIVASCVFCNTADNHYFDQAAKRGLHFDGLTPEQLVELRQPYVEATRAEYRKFWEANVSDRSPATG